MAVLVHFPTIYILCRLWSRLPNNLPTIWHDFWTICTWLLFIPDHSRSFWTVQNNQKRGHLDQVHRPLWPSKSHPHSVPTSLWLHKTFPDHQGRERSASRLAKCDRGLKFLPFVNMLRPEQNGTHYADIKSLWPLWDVAVILIWTINNPCYLRTTDLA